jgi:hypothetical protein
MSQGYRGPRRCVMSDEIFDLCRQIAKEPNPKKLSELLERLIKVLCEERDASKVKDDQSLGKNTSGPL